MGPKALGREERFFGREARKSIRPNHADARCFRAAENFLWGGTPPDSDVLAHVISANTPVGDLGPPRGPLVVGVFPRPHSCSRRAHWPVSSRFVRGSGPMPFF